TQQVHLEYWGSHWPEQHLPKDRAPGGGDVGWMELGNWYQGGWRVADAEATIEGSSVRFKFHPVNAKEFAKVKDYPAEFRYTLKLRVVSEAPLPKIERIEAFTDSTTEIRECKLAWKGAPTGEPTVTIFNGRVEEVQASSAQTLIRANATVNPDPNTFDRTLITVGAGKDV